MVDFSVNLTAIKLGWQRLHPFGKRVVVWATAAAAVFLLTIPMLFWLAAAVVGGGVFFFRNPKRVPPNDENVIVAPADGIVIKVAKTTAETQLSIFLSLWDVHIIRMPWRCEVVSVKATKGKYLPAYDPSASVKNARTTVETKRGTKRLKLVLVSGMLARKIDCAATKGSRWRLGQRLGLIYLGSRVDIRLPAATLLVKKGQRMVGGETVLARLGNG